MRKWSFLNLMIACRSVKIVMTQYAARHELSSIQDEVKKLEENGDLTIDKVLARSAAYNCYRRLLSEGVDKGEAEAMSWAADRKKNLRPIFISIDKKARAAAMKLGLPAHDIIDLAVIGVRSGFLDKKSVRGVLSVWDDKKQQFGRPADYTTFDETWKKRSSATAQR